MVKIILSGCSGRMGKVVTESVKSRNDCEIVAGVDIIDNSTLGYPVFQSFSELSIKADVIVDFSNPAILPSVLDYAKKEKVAVVIATTGISDENKALIKEASNEIAVFSSFNMSLGINLISELSKIAARILGNDFDIEIVEAHHNQKLDAPSGTALMLADSIKEELPDVYYEYNRQSKREKRSENEIGIHSIRGGTIVGEHEVIFAGNDEIIKISHSARSRNIFATGAINAALFVSKKKSGMYDMANLINE